MCANWVAEVRRHVANGAWYDISSFYGLRFRKEVNTKWSGDLNVLTPVPPQGGQKLHFDMEKLTDDSKMEDLSDTGGNDGTITGTTDVAGKYARARTFNGGTDKIAFGDVDLPLPFTIAAWIKPDATQTDASGAVVVKGTALGDMNYRLTWVKASTLIDVSFGDGVAIRTATSVGTVAAGTYKHIAVTFKANAANTDVTFYFNGVAEAVQTLTGQPVQSAVAAQLGQDTAAGNRYKGDIDEPYLYTRALDVSEIIDVMNASVWDLLQNNNEVRFRETVAAKEWFRGRIRDRIADEISNRVELHIPDNSILMADAKWFDRRTFPSVPANVIMDEIMNSSEREPKNGQVLYYDMESLTDAGLMRDLSGNGNNGTITGMTTITGKWGQGRKHAAQDDQINAGNGATLQITNNISVGGFVNFEGGSDIHEIYDKFTTNSGIIVLLRSDGFNRFIRVQLGDGTTTRNYDSGALGGGNPGPTGTNHYAVTVKDNGVGGVDDVRFYFNGDPKGAALSVIAAFVDSGTSALIANLGVSANRPSWDEVAVYNRTLSSAEVKVLAGTSILAGGLGTVDTFTSVGFRSEDEQRLNLVDAIARAVAGEWFVDRDADDKDRMNLVARIGNAASQDTFQFGVSGILKDRQFETETVVNDWTAIGNDATKQLKSRNFQASTIRTTLNADLTAAATSMTVVSTDGPPAFPSTGVVYIGGERIDYTGKTATTLTGLTRAFTTDGYPSIAAYAHSSGIEVWLHADKDTTPDTYYTPFTPQNDSSIKRWGLRSGTYTDQFYSDRNALDRLAQRFSSKFKDPRESVVTYVYEETITADIGDAVTLNDENGAPYFNSPYRAFALEYDHTTAKWTFQLGNYHDTFDRRVAEVRDDAGDAMYYAAAASSKGIASSSGTNVTLTTTTEKAIITATGTGIKAGEKVYIRGWAQLTTGTGTTTVTPRIRRGTGIAGFLVGEANAETIKVAAGGTEPFSVEVTDTAQQDDPIYTFSLTQAGASGNGTALQAIIDVAPTG